ncbi:MAG: hypothetical protein K5745_03540 [Saccharofermentans sp.]|nr:hypothetical protein [Saccharofermentans sp.]
MAQSRSNNNSTTKKKTSASRPKSSSNSARSKKQPVKAEPEVTFKDLFHRFSKTRIFKPLLTIVIIFVIIGLDLLISWNSYNTFFMLLGIELLISLVVWIFFLLKSASDPQDEQEAE